MTTQAPPSGSSRFGFRRPNIYYGWYIVIATGFVMTIATVPLFHAMTLWAVALENQFGWPRGQLSLALTLTRIEGGLMGPLEGYLTDKLGSRKMVLIGFIILGLGFLIFWQIDAGFWPVAPLYMFYVAYLVMAGGQGMGGMLGFGDLGPDDRGPFRIRQHDADPGDGRFGARDQDLVEQIDPLGDPANGFGQGRIHEAFLARQQLRLAMALDQEELARCVLADQGAQADFLGGFVNIAPVN